MDNNDPTQLLKAVLPLPCNGKHAFFFNNMAGNFNMKLFTGPGLHYQLQCYSDIHQFSAQNAFLFTQSFPVTMVLKPATANDFSRFDKCRFFFSQTAALLRKTGAFCRISGLI